MITLQTFIQRFNKIEPFVRKEAQKILVTQGKDIVEMVKEQQHEGVNRDAKKMQSGYSKGYGKRRKKKGLQTRFVDLHFTGKYHKSLNIVPQKDGVDVNSTEPYAYYLKGNFPGMAGLTPKNAEKVATQIANILAPKIKKYLVG